MAPSQFKAEITLLRRSKSRNIIIITFLIATTGYLGFILYSSPTIYRATSRICLPGEKTSTDFWTNTGLVSSTTVATETINSESFIRNSFDKEPAPAETFLCIDYRKIGTNFSFPFEVVIKSAPKSSARSKSYIITDAGDSTFLIKSADKLTSKAGLGTFNQEMLLDGFAIIIKRKNHEYLLPAHHLIPADYQFEIKNTTEMAAELLNGAGDLNVSQVNDVVKVSVSSTNPFSAALIANILAKSYMRQHNSSKSIKAPVHEDVAVAKDPKQNIAQNNPDQSYDINTLLQAAVQTKANLENITNAVRKNRESNYIISVPEISELEFLQNDLSTLGALYNKLDKAPADEKVLASIENIKNSIGAKLIDERKSIAIEIQKLDAQLQNQNVESNTVATKTEPTRTTEDQNTLIEQNGSSDKSFIPATALEAKAETNPVIYLIAALMCLIFFIAYRVAKINAQIFILNEATEEKKTSQIKTLGKISSQSDKNGRTDSSIANLCTEILTHNDSKVITFASLKKNEGKTFATSRVAASLASLDKKVLIIDMDLSEQELSTYFSVNPELTLADATEGRCSLLQAICVTPLPGLDLMSGGSFKHGIRSFLSWSEKDSALQQLRNFYDHILIDTTDLSAGPDAIPFMKWSDMNLVLHSNKTGKKELENTIERLTEEKGLQNLFLVENNPTAENKKPKMKVVSTPVIEQITETDETNNIKTVSTKPGFLKRVAMWFF